MRTFGLIGYPLSHSFSQKYFTEKFARENITDCKFKNFLLENINEFPALLKQNKNICGLNVTIPHKQSIIKFLDTIDEQAKTIGAVNCIKIVKTKSKKPLLHGFNTDIYGFEQSLKPLLKPYHNKALILGTGGAAKSVAYILDKSKIKFKFVSRTAGDISYSTITRSIIEEFLLIINATPVGMYPKVNEYPNIPYEFLTPKHLLYDLIYNPEETLFLKKGKEKGAQIKNGLEMLKLQAEKSWEIWNA